MAAVVFTELGIVINNTEYVYYLLPTLTKSAASTKLVMVMTGLDCPIQAGSIWWKNHRSLRFLHWWLKMLYARSNLVTW